MDNQTIEDITQQRQKRKLSDAASPQPNENKQPLAKRAATLHAKLAHEQRLDTVSKLGKRIEDYLQNLTIDFNPIVKCCDMGESESLAVVSVVRNDKNEYNLEILFPSNLNETRHVNYGLFTETFSCTKTEILEIYDTFRDRFFKFLCDEQFRTHISLQHDIKTDTIVHQAEVRFSWKFILCQNNK